MVELAVAGNEGFAVSDIEYRRPGTSYSVETAEELRRRKPGAALFFILGVDAFADLPLWREPERLTALTDFVVISRPGHTFASLAGSDFLDARPEGLGELDRAERDVLTVPLRVGRAATLVRVTPLGVSATAIRALRRAGGSIRYLLPAEVESFIMSHGLYAGA
jgi:nicotinate-nucleotide adenylyltransferase